ncbi:MAG: hypothetical protein JW740_00945 [Candidatus Zambryskibacteria bacterium]|nr:hypothetical protein [Candidatus Zambryskibacteria bacterium]
MKVGGRIAVLHGEDIDKRDKIRRKEMLDKNALLDNAKDAFGNSLKRELQWISEKRYPDNLPITLQKLNSVLEAGALLGVTKAKPMSTELLSEINKDLYPLRILDMGQDIYEYLVEILEKQGVETEEYLDIPPLEKY